MEQYKDFVSYIEETIKKYWDLDSLTDYEGSTFQYKDVARKIEKLHILFENAGVVKGDKIALCGRNSANWAVAFMATLSYGAVVVPILHEFKPEQVHNIVNHSDAKLLFVGDQVWPGLVADEMPNLEGIVNLDEEVIRKPENAFGKTGGIAVLKGNLAPNGTLSGTHITYQIKTHSSLS